MLKIDDETRALWARRARKERIKAVLSSIGAFFAFALFALVMWLFLVVTPDQRSAECEAIADELGK